LVLDIDPTLRDPLSHLKPTQLADLYYLASRFYGLVTYDPADILMALESNVGDVEAELLIKATQNRHHR
jgi:hypothetical protein